MSLESGTKNRFGSLRASMRSSSRKLTPSMISIPQNDLRHIGHVGFDGIAIGDVPFLSNSQDKLPLKTSTAWKSEDAIADNSREISLKGRTFANSISSTTISEGSSRYLAPLPSSSYSSSIATDLSLNDFADLRINDFTKDLDFGSSLFDEVMKALNATLNCSETSSVGEGRYGSQDTRRLDEGGYGSRDKEHLERKDNDDVSSNSTVVAETDDSDDDEDDDEAEGSLSLSSRDGEDAKKRIIDHRPNSTNPTYASSPC